MVVSGNGVFMDFRSYIIGDQYVWNVGVQVGLQVVYGVQVVFVVVQLVVCKDDFGYVVVQLLIGVFQVFGCSDVVFLVVEQGYYILENGWIVVDIQYVQFVKIGYLVRFGGLLLGDFWYF